MTRDLPGDLLRWMGTFVDGLPEPHREYKFHPTRKWRFDIAWPKQKVAVECHGNIWAGRHTRGIGYSNDREKANEAQLAGWILLEFTSGQIDSDPEDCAEKIIKALALRGTRGISVA